MSYRQMIGRSCHCVRFVEHGEIHYYFSLALCYYFYSDTNNISLLVTKVDECLMDIKNCMGFMITKLEVMQQRYHSACIYFGNAVESQNIRSKIILQNSMANVSLSFCETRQHQLNDEFIYI